MCCGKRFRCLMTFFVFACAVQAARPGLQPSAAVMPEMRGPTCADFGALTVSAQMAEMLKLSDSQRCYCVNWPNLFPSKDCGDIEEVHVGAATLRPFQLVTSGPTCRCISNAEKSREPSAVVQAAAVRFCTAVLEATTTKGPVVSNFQTYAGNLKTKQNFIQKDLKTSPQLCQEVLTGTLNSFSTSQESKDLFREANRLSEHKETKGFGHLDPLFTEKYKGMLHYVCKDECEEIVNETMENIYNMTEVDVKYNAMSFEGTCADRVVRKVEAEILGCCGRACGWNERSCTSWPFFTKEEKLEWLEECCSEYNILQNSSREVMCNSVLTPKQVRLLSDTKAQKGDVAGAYIGQDPRLLWARPGLDKFKKQLKKLKQRPKENEPVNSHFLEKNPDVREKGIQEGWFNEEKVTDDDEQNRPTSFAEMGSPSCKSVLNKLDKTMQHCPPNMQTDVRNSCLRKDVGWQISKKDDLDDDDDDECNQMIFQGRVEPRATPDDCLEVNLFGDVKIKRRFFLYDTSDPPDGKPVLEKPILCRYEPEQHKCPDDFDRKDLNDVDRFEGFADYIYWIEEKATET